MLDRKHLIKPTFSRKPKMTNECSRILLAFGAILRKLMEFKSPGSAVTVVAARVCRRHLSSPGCLQSARDTLLYSALSSPFHVSSLLVIPLAPLVRPPASRSPPFLPHGHPLSLRSPEFFRTTSCPPRKLQLGRIWRKFRSPSLP